MLTIEEVLQFKIKGVMNLDNAIVIDNYSNEEVKSFQEELQAKTGLPVETLMYTGHHFENNSIETAALMNLLEIQLINDRILSSDGIIIVTNLKDYYKNKIIEILSKSNPKFLIWYMTYQIQFNPMMHLDKLTDQFRIGPFKVEGESNLMEAYNKGLMEIERAISTKLAFDYQQTKMGEVKDGCGRTDAEQD